MKPIIDKQVFEQKSFSHKTVSPISYIIHEFKNDGIFALEVRNRRGKLIVETNIQFTPSSRNTNYHIDLYRLMNEKNSKLIQINSQQKHLLFYHSRTTMECRIRIFSKGQKKPEFDSHRPGAQDLYAINLLKPGEYQMKNEASKKKANLKFNFNRRRTDNLIEKNRSIFNITKDHKFAKKEMVASEGLVVKFSDEQKGFSLVRLKEMRRPSRATIIDDLKKEIITRRKSRIKKRKKKLDKKFQWKNAKFPNR